MAGIKDQANSVYRDFVVDGVPASGQNDPAKSDIRNLFSAVDIGIAAAQAGIKIVATTADRDSYYATPANQSKLVYVNNNNGSASDPANGVYEYSGGSARLAQGFYQGVASVVQPLVDRAETAASSAQASATTAQNAAYDIAYLNGETANGPLYKSDGSLSGWSGDLTAWSSVQKPALISYNPPPFMAQEPGPAGSSDHGGVREGYWLEDTDGTWYIFYGAGDGSTSGPDGPWRPQYAKSVDRGLNWTKLGEVPGISLNHGYDSGMWPSRDNLFVFRHTDGFYYFHTLTAGSVTQNQICGQPYTSDVWKASNINGPYTYVGYTLQQGPAGRFDALDAYASSLVKQGSTWHLFYSATRESGSEWYIGRATASTPYGPFTSTGVQVLPDNIRGQDENPEVFWHPVLAKWVMLTNNVNKALAGTDSNRAYFSDSLTDWSAAVVNITQRISPMDGVRAVGHSRPKRFADYTVDMDGLGNVPVIFDTDPPPDSLGNHTGRRLKYAVLEPSNKELRVQTTSSAGGDLKRSMLHDSFVADFCLVTYANQGSMNFTYRGHDDTYYKVIFDLGQNTTAGLAAIFSKVIAGTETGIANSVGATVRSVVGLYHRITVVVRGSVHRVYVDGELQINAVDGEIPYGRDIGFKGNGPLTAAVRGMTIRKNNDVTLKGRGGKSTISLRGVGYIPLAAADGGSGSTTLTIAHYPASSVNSDLANVYAPSTGVWGGDVIYDTNGQ